MALNRAFLLLLLVAFTSFGNLQVQVSPINKKVKKLMENSIALTDISAEYKDKPEGTPNNTLIKLNVGGKEIETTLNTLTSINNTYFTSLFSQINKVKLDDRGRIFIDRDGRLFSYILNYLRTSKIHVAEDHSLRLLLIDEAEYYQLNSLRNMLVYFKSGSLLDSSHQAALNEFYGVTNQKWQLLYKATTHGYAASTFHRLCDNKGPTMTVIRSQNGYLFGGFTKESWGGKCALKTDPTAFIFTLTNPHDIPPTKFMTNNKGINAIHACAEWLPQFGHYNTKVGHDIVVYDIRSDSISHTDFPNDYTDTTDKGKTLFTGTRNYFPKEVEVYGLA